MKYIFFVFFGILLITSNLSFSQENPSQVKPALQQKWIKKGVKSLKKNKSLSDLKLTEPEINSSPGFLMTTYRIIGDTRIQCAGGEWIYFRPHTMHENKEIGDVCIAITDKGMIYINYGHICGGTIRYISISDKIPQDANEFFNTFVSDIDDLTWKKLK